MLSAQVALLAVIALLALGAFLTYILLD